jgi:serine/threonine protein phosphatase PrpC
MTSRFSLYMTGQSDPGQVREYNEDAILWDAERDFALLADGMGGHNAGDVASRMCLEELNTILASALDKSLKGLKPNKGVTRQATLLRRAVGKANAAVFEDAQKNSEHRGMGTTIVATLFYDSKVVVAHLGDSRIYRLRKKALEQITCDHSLVQELLDQGVISDEEAEDNPYSHVITQAVGIKSRVVAEVNEFEVLPGDVYLLCSDGLTDMVKDEEIAETLVAAEGQWERAAQRLVDVANSHGGHDNISVVLVGVGGRK